MSQRPKRFGLVLSIPRLIVALLVIGAAAMVGLNSRHTSSAATTGDPYGVADSCVLSGSTTLIYGWAADPQDTARDGTPNVTVKVGTKVVTVPTSSTTYRTTVITDYIKKYHIGDPTPGGYGFVASFTGLYKGTSNAVSGTVLNVGMGTSQPLHINATSSFDGTTHNVFTGGVVPQVCLATRPTTAPTTPVAPPTKVTSPTPPTKTPAPAPPVAKTPPAPKATSVYQTFASSSINEKHSPYGWADYCSYENGMTVIYGWANDVDAPRGKSPSVLVTVSEYAHNPAISGPDQVVAASNTSVPTDGANYRDVAINAWIKHYRYGEATSAVYGFRAAYRGLVRGGYYHLSGTINNVGALGADVPLAVDAVRHVDGNAGRPYFAGNLIPEECLGPRPVATIKGKVNTPAPVPVPTAATSPAAKPVFSQAAPTHGKLTATGNFTCDSGYVKTATKCDKIRYEDISHGKKAVNVANKVICDKGYIDRHAKCEVNNDVVVAYKGYNDGCGGNATHYAANKKTHVSQVNYGKHSVCQCASNDKFVAYTKPISDSHDNKNCIVRSSSSRSSGGGSYSGSGNGSSTAPSRHSGTSGVSQTYGSTSSAENHISNTAPANCSFNPSSRNGYNCGGGHGKVHNKRTPAHRNTNACQAVGRC